MRALATPSDKVRVPDRMGRVPVENTETRLVQRGGRKAATPPPGRRKLVKAAGIDIKSQYRLTLEVSLAATLLLLILLFRMPLQKDDGGGDFVLDQQVTVQMEEIAQTEQIRRPPPPPRPPIPVEVPNDEVLDDVELDLDVSLDLDAAVDLPLPPAPPAPKEDPVAEEEEIFVVVEQMPEIIGGAAKVYEYLEYPDIARQAGVEGLSVIQLVVGPDGSPRDLTVARSAGEVLDVAAMKAVSQLRFVPGRQRGKPVSVRMAIPIRFRLKQVTKQ